MGHILQQLSIEDINTNLNDSINYLNMRFQRDAFDKIEISSAKDTLNNLKALFGESIAYRRQSNFVSNADDEMHDNDRHNNDESENGTSVVGI